MSQDIALVAPCGIDCRVCRAHMRLRNPCPGCRADDAGKPKTRRICRIKTCAKLVASKSGFCFDCDDFPCAHVLRLDRRYRTKYGTSVLENLLSIKKTGVNKFIKAEARKWTCSECGAQLCMHDPACPSCGHPWHRQAAAQVA